MALAGEVEAFEQRLQRARAAADAPAGSAAQWRGLADRLRPLLLEAAEGPPQPGWTGRLAALHGAVRQALREQPDAALYHLVHDAGVSLPHYSSRHALLALVLCESAAPLLDWPAEAADTLGLAALSMNVGMHALQDDLAVRDTPPTAEERETIHAHPAVGAQRLVRAGVTDELWLQVVRAHHEVGDTALPLAGLPPAAQLARLLRRVDIFAAKISRRARRAAQSPVVAARDAGLGVDGVPDEIGGALLKVVGLYPPGSFVELASGERGIVFARGRRTLLPLVAALVSAGGNLLPEPGLRDTQVKRYAVRRHLPPEAMKVPAPPHERLAALR
jgi:hypothetical protein